MISRLFLAVLRLYQLTLSPLLGPRCRFFPSCSSYWMDAIREHGPGKGSYLGLIRLLKCHPFHPGGVDHAPARHVSAGTGCLDIES